MSAKAETAGKRRRPRRSIAGATAAVTRELRQLRERRSGGAGPSRRRPASKTRRA